MTDLRNDSSSNKVNIIKKQHINNDCIQVLCCNLGHRTGKLSKWTTHPWGLWEWNQASLCVQQRLHYSTRWSLLLSRYQSDSNCDSEKKVRSKCPNGIVYEPCVHCKTCANGIGETCGGLHGLQGRCEQATLECTVGVGTFGIPDENITGVCVTLRKY